MYISSQFPYYDDFDPSKGFQKVLFRPGRAVQARELTQLQTMLQNQIATLGKHLFKEGSLVFSGNDPGFRKGIDYVKLELTYSGTDADDVLETLLAGNKKLKAANNLTASVQAIASSSGADLPTIWVNYENKADDTTTRVFTAGDVLTYTSGATSITVQVDSVGKGTGVYLPNNYLFVKDNFVQIQEELKIVSKYTELVNASIGFRIYEEIVTYADDSSLLDPAVSTEGSGDSNYYALGADRYKLRVELEARNLLDDTSDTDPDFFEFIRVIDGNPQWVREEVIYDTIAKELARRTFEESGDYAVDCFPLQLMEHSNSSNAKIRGYYTTTGNANLMVGLMGPGIAYVKGYRVENQYNVPLSIEKSRDYDEKGSVFVNTDTGNYIIIDSLFGLPNIATDLEQISIYNKYKSTWYSDTTLGSIVGTARVRHIELHSGTPGTDAAQYKLYLFDVTMEPGQTFTRTAKSFKGAGIGAGGFTANILPTLGLLTGGVSTTNNSNVITGTRSAFVLELADPVGPLASTYSDYITVRGSTVDQEFEIADVQGAGQLIANSNATVTTSDVPYFVHQAIFENTDRAGYLYRLPESFVKTVDPNNTETVFAVKAVETATLSSSAATITIGGAVNAAWQVPTNESTLLCVTSGTKRGNVYPAVGYVTRSSNQKSLTIDLTSVAGVSTSTIAIISPKTKTLDQAARRTKTRVNNRTFDVTTSAVFKAQTISLDRADGIRLVSVSESSVSGSYNSSGARDITDNYTFDNGQRITHYGLARITRKSTAAAPNNPIRVTFDYFSHGATGDYFSVDSYTDGGTSFDNVPYFNNLDGEVNLADYIDCRPVINQAGTGFSSTGAVKPDFLDLTDTFSTSLQYYLAQTALISIDNTGKFNITYGPSALDAASSDPQTPKDSMALYKIRMKPYVRNIDKDVTIENLCSIRYTMKDIGKLDRRITNLEYYTSLNLLEKSTESLQIKDQYGLDRFKNGFIVDNFTGFGVMDSTSSAALDLRTNELRPKFTRRTF
jgi:Domain of unknown function (DUF4815)